MVVTVLRNAENRVNLSYLLFGDGLDGRE